jgi:hypothetical protein
MEFGMTANGWLILCSIFRYQAVKTIFRNLQLLLCPESQITVTCFDVLTMVSKLFLPFDNHSQQRWARQRKEEKNVIRVYTSVTSHVSEIRQCSKATSLRTLVEDRSSKIEFRTPNSNLCTVIHSVTGPFVAIWWLKFDHQIVTIVLYWCYSYCDYYLKIEFRSPNSHHLTVLVLLVLWRLFEDRISITK